MTSSKSSIIENPQFQFAGCTPILCKCGRRFLHTTKLELVECPFCGNTVQLLILDRAVDKKGEPR